MENLMYFKVKRIRTALIIWMPVLFLINANYQVCGQTCAKWVKISDSNNILLFQKDSTHFIKHFKAEFTLEASLEKVTAYITNTNNYKNWTGSLEDFSLVEKQNDTVGYFHFLLNVRPVYKREGIVKTDLGHSNNGIGFHYTLVIDTLYPYPNEYDKVKYFRLEWQIKPITSKKTEIHFYYVAFSKKHSQWVFSLINQLYIYAFESLVDNLKEGLELN
ncbi:MAG: hypothetical protein K9H64_11325 [Bacteroidales bacterium]|nr:hypothetical protein [Bacteroidales bacterium]MCF8456542.1 hypothetical protein [Bacteroidales bacterium]